MYLNRSYRILLLTVLGSFSAVFADPGTAFTYQGQLSESGEISSGDYDFTFRLYNAVSGGIEIGTVNMAEDFSVVDGVFTFDLDFGDVFDGAALWLEIAVRPGASTETDDFVTLLPRQPLNPAPYARYSVNAESLTGTLDGAKITGTIDGGLISGTIDGDQLSGSVDASILTGALDGSLLTTGSVDGSALIAGSVTYKMLESGILSALDSPDGSVVDALVVDNQGRVGIGEVSPDYKLEVNGTVAATTFVGDGSLLTGRHYLDASDGLPGEALYVDEDGEVGIGTTEPGYALEVIGTVKATSIMVDTLAADTLSLAGSSLTIDADGDVGINITNPAQKLEIYDGNISLRRSSGDANSHLLFRNSGGWYGWRVSQNAADDFVIAGGSGSKANPEDLPTRLTIDNDGNVILSGDLEFSDGTSVGSWQRTGVYNVSGGDFLATLGSNQSKMAFDFTTAQSAVMLTGSTTAIVAPVHLPQGATVTKVTIHGWDESSSKNLDVRLCKGEFHRDGRATMASHVSSTSSGAYTTTLTSISVPTINNTTNAYFVRVVPADEASWSSSYELGINGVVIEYTESW